MGFSIVRNPFSRLVSVYKGIFETEGDRPFIYQNYLGGILPKYLSFNEFVFRICQIPDRLKDQHIKPQYLFIKPYQKMNLKVQIFKLEEPGPINEFLSRYKMDFPHLNKGTNGSNYNDYYSKKTKNIVEEMYAHDFELFNYEQKIPD